MSDTSKQNLGCVVAIIDSALGWDWDVGDILTTGDRIFQLKRLMNLPLGVTAADATLPERFLTEPRPDGSAGGILPDLDGMLPIYHELRNWGEDGVPRRLAELGLPGGKGE